jgi:uncharacterized protein (DUF427 family)
MIREHMTLSPKAQPSRRAPGFHGWLIGSVIAPSAARIQGPLFADEYRRASAYLELIGFLKERKMVKAIWNGATIAESSDTVVVEGNHYFPSESVHPDLLRPSATTSRCPWKGTASYHSIEVDGKSNPDAAWYYPDPLPAAAEIKGRIAFWKGVKVG